ncbi:restriction endonuclease subunit S [Actinobacillus porcinus]|uniref:restriction endonuclease subunit S n=1 Tax=Actinobacillus porcinus TaxID=51048 RepID=UPI002A90A485|nr:restriction endonuclease subunit S [Actinobacillus porcinus]MDY6215803.1 restriction endonuclease subunit S [Actinobacillus porcinus]
MSKLVPFSDLFDIPLRNGVTKPKKIRGEGYKMVNMGELFANPIIDNIQMDRVPLTETEKNSLLKSKDLLFARQSLIRSGAGQCSIFMDDVEDVCFESHIIRCRLHKDKANPLFYFYLFKSNYGREIMDPIIEQGAGASGIRGSDLSKLQVPYVELDKQNFIAEQLYDLDRKIQLNTQINQTLEQIAQTIFKSWFIDFDPIHAKANALASGQTAEQATQAAMAVISGKNTQELHRLQTANPEQYQQLWEIAEAFPSGFDEEGVPRGWTVKRIEDVIRKIPTGKKYSQKTAFEVGNIPILDQGKSGVIGYHNDEAGVKASIENPVIVFANHTCYMRLISYDFSAIQNVFAFVGKESNVLWTYLATLGKQEFTEYKGHFPDFLIKEIIVPNNELTELFGVVVKEHFQQIACNDKQNKTLANLRDLLLPKLLGGYL